MVQSINITQELVAGILGYTSIACWLCAQFPQVIKNAKLKSCEGLALPFLVNWLFGDITNIIGCILTDQLPFQTYLAGYFCLVDVTLVAQFLYYQPRTIKPVHPRHVSYTYPSPQQSLILPHPSPRTTYDHRRSTSLYSTDRHPPRPKLKRGPTRYSIGPTSNLNPNSVPEPINPDGSYQAIYEAALDVARAAERASERRSRSRRRRFHDPNPETDGGRITGHVHTTHSSGDNMMASFHSESSDRSIDEMSASTPALMDSRGRSLQRTGIDGLPDTNQTRPGDEMRQVRSQSRSVSMVRGSGGRGKGRRAAGVAFMSFGLLFGFSTFVRDSRGSYTSSRGRVIPYRSHIDVGVVIHSGTSMIMTLPETPHPPEFPTFQRTVGRISAWTCTTLYLTSRLPQIWKNFTRKSVEGLSMLLFIFAFCGNFTYVLSILLNPAGGADPSEANHYLLEALPYLLGSGGTLIFDLTIMIQSILYGSSPPIASNHNHHPRRKSTMFTRQHRHLEEGLSTGSGSLPGSERQPLLRPSRLLGNSQVVSAVATGSHVV